MRSFPVQTRRPGVLAVHSVDEFVYSVPQLEEAKRFYTAFGLDVKDENGWLGLYTDNNPHRWARIYQSGQNKRLQWLTWGIYHDDWTAFEAHLKAKGVRLIEAPAMAQAINDSDGLWFEGPDGLAQRLRVAAKCSPSVKSRSHFPVQHCNKGRAPQRSQVTQVRPRHLSHILTFTADVERSMAFYLDVLGLRLSDRSDFAIAFLHTPHGSDHHLLALAVSEGYGLHHSSWDVSSFDDVGLGMQQMIQAGYDRGWGMGRHVLGSNYFRYVRDPWGSYAEYSFDIDHVPSTFDWPSGNFLPEDSIYVWGPDIPEDFIQNFETV